MRITSFVTSMAIALTGGVVLAASAGAEHHHGLRVKEKPRQAAPLSKGRVGKVSTYPSPYQNYNRLQFDRVSKGRRSVLGDRVYGVGTVHPGFYGGFDRYPDIRQPSGDTNVDVRVGPSAAPVVVAPSGGSNGSAALAAELDALRRENRQLRQSIDGNLDYLGIAATAQGPGSAELRRLIGEIIARRDRERAERVSGARVAQIDEYQRELGDERKAVRDLEKRARNPHILYLGFDD